MVGPRSKIFIRLGLIVIIGLAALGMRLYFANRHIIDQDEPTYLNAALSYTNYLRSGQYTWLAWDQDNYQHPVLSKILYGSVLLTQDPLAEMHDKNFNTGMPIQSAEGRAWGLAARYTSAALGTIASLAVAAFNPLAGLVDEGKVLFHLAGKRPGVIARLADEMASIRADYHGSPVHVSRPGHPDDFFVGKSAYSAATE